MGMRTKQTKFEVFTLCGYGEMDVQKIIDKKYIFLLIISIFQSDMREISYNGYSSIAGDPTFHLMYRALRWTI